MNSAETVMRTIEDLSEVIIPSDDGDFTELRVGFALLSSPAVIEEVRVALVNKSQLLKLHLAGAIREVPAALAPFLEAVFPHHPNLLLLDLSWNAISAVHIPRIASVVNNSVNLKVLNLRENYLRNWGAQALAEGIRANEILEKLYLNCNRIEADGNLLQRLRLSSNGIGDDDYEEIASALGQNTTLVFLNLSCSDSITRRGAASLKECFRTSNYTLEELSFSFDVGRMDTDIKDIIRQNGRLRDAFADLQNNGVPIPPRVWPRIMTLANAKPEFLYLILRTDTNLIKQERAHFELHTPDPINFFG